MSKGHNHNSKYHLHHEHHHDAHSPNNCHNHTLVGETNQLAKQKNSMRLLKIVIFLTFSFAFIEAISGYFFKSLALMSDAAHMFTDSSSLFLALLMAHLGMKPADKDHSYGHSRYEVLGALANALFMFIVIGFIFFKAIEKLYNPVAVDAVPMLFVASLGLIINIFAFLLLHKDDSMNIKAATLHILGDLLGSVAAIVAAIIIIYTGLHIVDPILSILLSLILIPASLSLLKQSTHILLDGVPKNINFYEVGDHLKSIKNVKGIHDLHIWSLDMKNHALSAHVSISDISEWNTVLKDIQKTLFDKYHIVHVTLQPEIVKDSDAIEHEPLSNQCTIQQNPQSDGSTV